MFAEHPAAETFVEPSDAASGRLCRRGADSNSAVAPPPPSGPSRDTVALILDIVAAKTGYPASMLTPDMELEEMGIDFIKRVEILAAVRQALPDLPAIDPSELASLTTLRAIGERFAAAPGLTPPAAAPAAAAASDASPKTVNAQSDIAALLLDIIAEKTGYPVSMLKPLDGARTGPRRRFDQARGGFRGGAQGRARLASGDHIERQTLRR